MSFKYINPGYAVLLDGTDTTLEQTATPSSSRTKTGVCYTYLSDDKYNEEKKKIIQLDEFYSDIWLKFDCYAEDTLNALDYYSGCSIYISLPYSFSVELNINIDVENSTYTSYTSLNDYEGEMFTGYSAEEFTEQTNWKIDDINQILIHAHYNVSSPKFSGTLELKINGKTVSYQEDSESAWSPSWGGSDTNFVKISSNTVCEFSNLIISNNEISPDEKIISLPIHETTSTMATLEGGTYVADKVGQKILQNIDVSAVADIYGDDAPLTGFLLIANPAYTDSDTGYLTAISKFGSDTSEYGTFEVNTDSSSAVYASWSVASDTTISDLNGAWFGWKASD